MSLWSLVSSIFSSLVRPRPRNFLKGQSCKRQGLLHLRLKLRFAVTRNIQAYLPEFGIDALGSKTVSGIINDLGFLVVFFKSKWSVSSSSSGVSITSLLTSLIKALKSSRFLTPFSLRSFLSFILSSTMSPPCELYHERSLHSFSYSPFRPSLYHAVALLLIYLGKNGILILT